MTTFTVYAQGALPGADHRAVADFIWDQSWGRDYPCDPVTELRASLMLVCGRDEQGALIAVGSLGRGYEYDGTSNDLLWLGHAVVAPTHRQRGLYRTLWNMRVDYARQQGLSPLHLCTTNPHIAAWSARHGWEFSHGIIDPADGQPAQIWRSQLL